MSKAAQEFISPLSFKTLSQNRVAVSLFEFSNHAEIEHIQLAQSFDMIVVAPATANIIAKFATGLADDLISTILLASNVPLLFAPAMNCEMWQKKVVQENIQKIQKQKAIVLEPQEGSLAVVVMDWVRCKSQNLLLILSIIIFSPKKTLQAKKSLREKIYSLVSGLLVNT